MSSQDQLEASPMRESRILNKKRLKEKYSKVAGKVKGKTPPSVKNRFDARADRKMDDTALDIKYECQFLEDIIDAITTGDIFLMSGTETFSRVIKRACMTTWSHIGMAVVDPPRAVIEALAIPEHWNSSVFIFEADTETWDQRKGGGVQLVCLRAYLEDCYKEYGPTFLFIWRSIVIPGAISNFWEAFPNFASWMLEQAGKGYKTSKKELAASALGVNRREDLQNLFCSELVALAYFELSLLRHPNDGGKRANNYVPRDFSSGQRMDGKDIILLGDSYFEPERRLKLTNPPVVSDFVHSQTDIPNIGHDTRLTVSANAVIAEF